MFGKRPPPAAPPPPDPRLQALEARLSLLEQRHDALAGFIEPALWDVLDRLYDNALSPQVQVCLACGLSALDTAFSVRVDQCVFGGGRLKRLQCPDCGCVFGPAKYLQTPLKIVEADYRNLYLNYSEGDSTEAELRAFHLLRPRSDGVYLNWGSGAWSATIERLRASGWDVWGFEPHAQIDSPYVVKRRDQIAARFDGVFSNNIIEHLFDPAAQFADFHALLKPGGRMVHASPCYRWAYAFTRFHVFFPLEAAPARLAARTGFELTESLDDGDFCARVFQAC